MFLEWLRSLGHKLDRVQFNGWHAIASMCIGGALNAAFDGRIGDIVWNGIFAVVFFAVGLARQRS